MSQDPNRSTESTAHLNITAKAVSEPRGSNTSDDLKFRNVEVESGMSEFSETEGGAVDDRLLEKKPIETSASGIDAIPGKNAPQKKNLKSLLEGNESPEKPQEDRTEVDREEMDRLWDRTTPMGPTQPLPSDIYKATLEERKATTTKNRNPACRLKFRLSEGPHAGKALFKTVPMTKKSLPFAKADLSRVNTKFSEINDPLTATVSVRLLVAQQKGADGKLWNTVDIIEQVSVTPLGPDPFAPDNVDGTSEGAA